MRYGIWLSIALSVGILANGTLVFAQSLRVVAYNVDADTNGAHGSMGGDIAGPGLTTVLQAIGNATLAGNSRPIDVLALEELNATPSFDTGYPSVTLDYVVSQLNGIYGPGTYAADIFADPTTGGTGGGPSGLVYNTKTVQVLAAAAVGSASSSGAPRAPMRYTLAPLGYNDHSADFTMYVSHAKANSGSGDNVGRRNTEAIAIRDNAATLGANAHVIYSGDFNILSSTEAAFVTLTAPLSPTAQINAGQAIDTLGNALSPPGVWSTSSTYRKLFTESADSISARFDLQLVTNPMVDANQPGMRLIANSLVPFGNNGTIAKFGSVTDSGNTALADLGATPYDAAYRTSVLTALTTATDHLPIVADYSFASAVGIAGDYDHSGVVNAADYSLWLSSFGSTTSLAADGNANGIVDAADYSVWRDHFGNHIPPGAGAGALAAVPEPSTALLLSLGVCLAGLWAGKLRG